MKKKFVLFLSMTIALAVTLLPHSPSAKAGYLIQNELVSGNNVKQTSELNKPDVLNLLYTNAGSLVRSSDNEVYEKPNYKRTWFQIAATSMTGADSDFISTTISDNEVKIYGEWGYRMTDSTVEVYGGYVKNVDRGLTGTLRLRLALSEQPFDPDNPEVKRYILLEKHDQLYAGEVWSVDEIDVKISPKIKGGSYYVTLVLAEYAGRKSDGSEEWEYKDHEELGTTDIKETKANLALITTGGSAFEFTLYKTFKISPYPYDDKKSSIRISNKASQVTSDSIKLVVELTKEPFQKDRHGITIVNYVRPGIKPGYSWELIGAEFPCQREIPVGTWYVTTLIYYKEKGSYVYLGAIIYPRPIEK